jgi:hypothetical protein
MLSPDSEAAPATYARVAGASLLLMAALALFASFFVFESLIVPDDAGETARNILDNEVLFRSGIAAFVGVAVLDVLVAWALYVFLRPVHSHFAILAAWLRLAYAATLAVAIGHYLNVSQLLGDTQASTVFETDQLHAQVMLSVDAFGNGWVIGLVLFGFHLLVLGYIMATSNELSRIIGVLLMVAGVGYLVDSTAQILLPNYADYETVFLLIVAVPGVIGELSFAFWLLLRGARARGSTV